MKKILNIKLTKYNYSTKLNNIISEHWNKIYRSVQDQYDKETDFSKHIKVQLKWSQKIKRLLKEYEEFQEENYTLKLNN